MNSLVNHRTFSGPLDSVPAGKNLVTAKIVLDLKLGEDNEILKYKTRLVAQGFSQKHGIDFEETFIERLRAVDRETSPCE